MTNLVLAVLAASLLGSAHCAGMCGAFVAIACGATETSRVARWRLAGAYHAGRLATYVAVGAAAGTVGRLMDLTGALAGLRFVAAPLAAVTILTFAMIAWARGAGASLPRPPLPERWLAALRAAHRAAMYQPPVLRAGAIGLLTTLLPCGWLYAFVVTAAGTGSPLSAAMVMTVFWLGTLPALILVGAGARGLLGPLGQYLPRVTTLAVAVVAVVTLFGRAQLNPDALATRLESFVHAASAPNPASTPPCCTTVDTKGVRLP